MARLFYVKRGERVVGPTALVTLRQHAESGRLRKTDLVGESEDGPWRAATGWDELARFLASSVEDNSEWDRAVDEQEAHPLSPAQSTFRPTVGPPGSRRWVLLGVGMLLLVGGGGLVMFLSGGAGDEDSSTPPPQPVVLLGGGDHFKRAQRLDAAGRVLDRADAWVSDDQAVEDDGLSERKKELRSTAEELGESSVVARECLRIDDLLDRYTSVRLKLEEARQEFVDLDPVSPRYVDLGVAASDARRIGVARLTRSADEFIEVLRLAQDEQAALGRLVPMSQADFDRSTLVMPLKSTSPRSRLLALANYHAHLRSSGKARQERQRLGDERTSQTVTKNRKSTAAAPALLKTAAQLKAAVDELGSRNGSRIILAWNPTHDCFWRASDKGAVEQVDPLQAVGMSLWPGNDNSLKVQVPSVILEQLTAWIGEQRQAARKLAGEKPQGERPLYFVSKQARRRFLTTGHWGFQPEVIVAGELGMDTGPSSGRPVLTVDAVAVGVAPTRATLAYNRKHWGLLGRVIRGDGSFAVTLHQPKTIRLMGGQEGPEFDPYGGLGADKSGGGELGYLRMLLHSSEADIKTINESITARMRAAVKKTGAILPAVTLARLEQGLVSQVGNKQAKIDARTIGGAGIRSLVGVLRLAEGSSRLYSDGALYAYNFAAMGTSLSRKGRSLFDSEIRNRILVFVVARDGIWLMSSRELCELAEKALPRAGFYSTGNRKPLVPADRDPDVLVFEPSVPPAPLDPKAPRVPVPIVEPDDADGQAACRKHVAQRAAAYQAALETHHQNIKNGVYKADTAWREFQQATAEWERFKAATEQQLMLRKKRLGQSIKLREEQHPLWNQLARSAFDGVKGRAGRAEKNVANGVTVPRDCALLPVIREALEFMLTGDDK